MDDPCRQLFQGAPDPLLSYEHIKFIKIPDEKLPPHLMMSSPNLQRLLFWPALVLRDVEDLINSYPNISRREEKKIRDEHERHPVGLTARLLDCDFQPTLVIRLPGDSLSTVSRDFPDKAINFDDMDEFRVSRNSCESLTVLTSSNPTSSTHLLARNFRRALHVAIDMGKEPGTDDGLSLVSPNSPPGIVRVSRTPEEWSSSLEVPPTRPRRGKRDRDPTLGPENRVEGMVDETPRTGRPRHRIDNGSEAEALGVGVVETHLCGESTPTTTPTEPKPVCNNQVPIKHQHRGLMAHSQKHEEESLDEEGGSRLVLNKTSAITHGPNTRTCLQDALMVFVPSSADTDQIREALIASMPPSGDTPVSVARKALSDFGIDIKVVTGLYDNKTGGIAYHLLQERQCKLILRIKLTNKGNRVSSHFVAWDGSTIHDRPYMIQVSDVKDRRTYRSCREVFNKLYRKFLDWRITRVYSIIEKVDGNMVDETPIAGRPRRRIDNGSEAEASGVGVVETRLCGESTPTTTPTEPRPVCKNQSNRHRSP